MNYRIKRYKTNLTPYTVSKRIGMEFNEYMKVERGDKDLRGEQLTKFLEVIENHVQIENERTAKMFKIVKMFKDGIIKEIAELKQISRTKMANDLKLSQGHISNALVNNGTAVSEDTYERIYDYLGVDEWEVSKKAEEESKMSIEEYDIDNEIVKEEMSTQEIKEAPTMETIDGMRVSALEKEVADLREQLEFYKKIINTMSDLATPQQPQRVEYVSFYEPIMKTQRPYYNNNYRYHNTTSRKYNYNGGGYNNDKTSY